MTRLIIPALVLALTAAGFNKARGADPIAVDSVETRYLLFQLMTGLHGYAGPQPAPGHFSLSKAQLDEFVRDVKKAIGVTGDARHKLGFTVGPLCFDMSDEETRQFIQDSFAVAREHDVAVAFHIDDSMSWGQRQDLLANPDNIEIAGWEQKSNTGRRADWGPKPTRFPPQMCFNSPEIRAAVKERGALIGAGIKKELDALKASDKEHLFAGVIAGWETRIGRDFETGSPLGYRALSHRGFSAKNPPGNPDLERVQVVKEFMELWANALHGGGIARERIFCHIAFTSQGLRAADAKESYATKVDFSVPEVAFSTAYRPGFSTYPEASTLKEIYAILAKHGSAGWISGEGVNVSPTGMPGEPTMETYLGRMFNHGAVMTNIFSWGMGGEAMRNNFFRRATENPEALAAYAKFLRNQTLVESAAGFSAEAFQGKMRRIQKELPAWVQESGQHAKAAPLAERITALIKDRKWEEADKVADAILSLISSAPQDDEMRKHLLHELAGPFIVFRGKVQEALKLSDEQKHALVEKLPEYLPETMKAIEKFKDLPGKDREKAMQAHRQKSGERFERFLKEALKTDQFQRLKQLELQHDGPAALGRPEIREELAITQEQLRQFMGIVQGMQKKIEPLMKEAQAGGNPLEIRPKVIKIRKDHEAMMEAVLSESQRKQWKEKLGKPVDVLDE